MKKQLHFKILLSIALCLFVYSATEAQNFETAKTVSKNKAVPGGITINISNHSGDMKINTTNDNTVSIQTEIKVNAKSEIEVDKLIAAVEDFKFELNGKSMNIDTRFYKNMKSINNRTTITLQNGDQVRIKDFEIRHELNIPKSANLNLNNKYSTVILAEVEGKAKLNLYSCKLRSEGFLSEVKLDTKYSKLQVEKFGDNVTFNFYDSDIEFKTARNITMNGKYSKVEGKTARDLKIDSYDDKILIHKFSNLKMEAKYTDVVSEASLNNLTIDLYDSNLKINSAKTVKFTGKYCELKLGDVEFFETPDSYDNDVYLGNTNFVNITTSKYSKYQMNTNSKLETNSYDDDVIIGKLNPDFKGISFNGKYGKVEISSAQVPFGVDVLMKYGKVDIPKSVNITKHIEKNGQLEMLGGNNSAVIKIRGHDNALIVK